MSLSRGDEEFTVNRPLNGFISLSGSTAESLLLWDVLVGEPGMVGSAVDEGEDERGGVLAFKGEYPPLKLRW